MATSSKLDSWVNRTAVAVACVAVLVSGAAFPAQATEDESESSRTVVVDGRTFDSDDGLVVVEESYPITEVGGAPVGNVWATAPDGDIGPLAAWGASYAYSEHPTDFTYYGYGHAAGNVYAQQRIVKVCFFFTQGTRTSATTCSSATSNGSSWSPGPHAFAPFADSLDPNAPVTVFNIQTTRIAPNIY